MAAPDSTILVLMLGPYDLRTDKTIILDHDFIKIFVFFIAVSNATVPLFDWVFDLIFHTGMNDTNSSFFTVLHV